MKTMKELLNYEVDKKFVVFSIFLLLTNVIILNFNLNHFYWYVFLFSLDYYTLKYMIIVTNKK